MSLLAVSKLRVGWVHSHIYVLVSWNYFFLWRSRTTNFWTVWKEVLEVKEGDTADIDGDSEDEERRVDHVPGNIPMSLKIAKLMVDVTYILILGITSQWVSILCLVWLTAYQWTNKVETDQLRLARSPGSPSWNERSKEIKREGLWSIKTVVTKLNVKRKIPVQGHSDEHFSRDYIQWHAFVGDIGRYLTSLHASLASWQVGTQRVLSPVLHLISYLN